MDYSTDAPPARPKGECPVCSSRAAEGALFCASCGAFLRDEQGRRPQKRNGHGNSQVPDGLEQGFVQLLGEITQLQRDLLRQFRQGQALQVRQFERALTAQALGLEKTLAHADARAQVSDERLQVWQRWTAGLVAAVFVLFVIAWQVV